MKHVVPIPEKHDGKLGDRSNTRVWLRLLSCTMAIEKELQRRFVERGTTLPRFDVLAALDRNPDGMTMGALSKALLVSNGNITQLTQKLKRDGLIDVTPLPSDRRTQIVRMTEEGAQQFHKLARAHNDWIDQMLAGLDFSQRERMYVALGTMKISIAKAAQGRKAR